MGRGAWEATVHVVAKSGTRLSTHTHKWLKTTQIYHLTLLEVRNRKWVSLGDIALWGSRKETIFFHFQVLETPTILWAMTPF